MMSREVKAEYDKLWYARKRAKEINVKLKDYIDGNYAYPDATGKIREGVKIEFKYIDPFAVNPFNKNVASKPVAVKVKKTVKKEEPKAVAKIPASMKHSDEDTWHKINVNQVTNSINENFFDEKKQVKDILRAIIDNENVLIEGWTGTAKTFLLQQIAQEVGVPMRVLNMQIDTSSDSIKGKYAIDKDGKVVWVDGAIVQAMKNGEMLVIEEINFIQPEVSSTIYSVTDYRRSITLDEKDHETVRAHPNFRIIATRNPDYQGTNRLNPALENRFTVQFFIDYLNWENEAKLLQSRYALGKEDSELLCKTASKLRQMREEFDNDLSTRVVEACARRFQAGTPMNKAIEMTVCPIVAKDKENRIKVTAIYDTLVREATLQKKKGVTA